MTTSFFILLSIPAVCFVILVLCSPRGYQDEKGFHSITGAEALDFSRG